MHPQSPTILLRESGGLKEGDLALPIQVLFVPAEDDDDVGAGERPRVRQPMGQSVVGLPAAVWGEKRGFWGLGWVLFGGGAEGG